MLQCSVCIYYASMCAIHICSAHHINIVVYVCTDIYARCVSVMCV